VNNSTFMQRWAVNALNAGVGLLLARGLVWWIAPTMHFPLWFYVLFLAFGALVSIGASVRLTRG